MSGVLRLANTGGSNGRSTIVAAASTDATFTLPSAGGTILTTDFDTVGDITWNGSNINITNADLNVNSGQLFVDESTGFVGVGVAGDSIDYKLHVASVVSNDDTPNVVAEDTTAFTVGSNGASFGFLHQNANGNQLLAGVIRSRSSNVGSNGHLELLTRRTGTLTRSIFLDANGNVGVGGAATEPVTITRNGGFDVSLDPTNGGSGAQTTVTAGTSLGQIAYNRRGSNGAIYDNTVGSSYINIGGNGFGGYLQFAVNSTPGTAPGTAMTIDSSGRLLVGTTSSPSTPAAYIVSGGAILQRSYTDSFNIAVGGTVAVDIKTLVELGYTYQIFCKINNGNGDTSGHILGIISVVDASTAEGFLQISIGSANGRSVVHSGNGVFTFGNTSFNSRAGYIITCLGTNFGT